VREAEMQIYL